MKNKVTQAYVNNISLEKTSKIIEEPIQSLKLT